MIALPLSLEALTFRMPDNGDDLIGEPFVVRSRYEDTMAVYAELFGFTHCREV